MSVTVVRWVAGAGGDTLFNLLIQSYPQAKSNVVAGQLQDNGRTDMSGATELADANLLKVALTPDVRNTINLCDLEAAINDLKQSDTHWFIKSHMDIPGVDASEVINLVPSEYTLPFIINALVNKIPYIIQDLLRPLNKLTNNYNINVYNITEVLYTIITNSPNTNTILVDDLITDWQHLNKTLARFNFKLTENCKPYYTAWLSKNTQYFPSQTYKNYISNKNYNYKDPSLSLIESCCLLAISKQLAATLKQL